MNFNKINEWHLAIIEAIKRGAIVGIIFLFFAWSKISTILEEKGHSKHPEVERSVFSSEQKSISAGKLLENEKKTKKDFFRNHIKRNATFSHLMLTRKRSNSLKTLKSEQFINWHTIIKEQDEKCDLEIKQENHLLLNMRSRINLRTCRRNLLTPNKSEVSLLLLNFFRLSSIADVILVTKCSSSAESLKAAGVLSKSTFFPKNLREIPTHSHKSGEHKDRTKERARVSSTKMGINIPPDQLALCHFCLRAPFSL